MDAHCCYINPADGSYCLAPAVVRIDPLDPADPYLDSNACEAHIAALIPDEGAAVTWLG